MAKKKVKVFTRDELTALLDTLGRHKARLAAYVRDKCVDDVSFHDACEVRNAAQFLVTTQLTIQTINDLIIKLVDRSGEPESVPHLDDCGLDWEPE